MATTPTSPVSAPTSAPSAPSSSTPPPVAPPSTPPSPPPSTTEITPTAPPAESTSAPSAAPKAQPTQADFDGDPEAFLTALHAWERETGQVAEAPPEDQIEVPKPEPPKAEEVPAVEAPKVDEPAKKEEAKEEVAPPEVKAPEKSDATPETINALLTKDPALKAALDANPEAKRTVFAMARVNAKAQGLLEIFPNAEAGKFANDTANQYVGMKSAFENAVDNPETFPDAFEQFASQFQITKDGKPVLDSAGNPVFDKDFHMLMNHVVDAYIDDEISEFEKLVETSNDENDNIALSALRFVKELKEKRLGEAKAPDMSKLTPEQQAWQQRQQAAFDEERKRLGLETQQLTSEQKKATRTAWEKSGNQKIGASVGKFLDTFLKEKEQQNVFLPSYVTDVKDPVTGQSMFAIQVFNEFNKKVMSIAHLNQQLIALKNSAPTPENEALRVQFYNQQVADFLPDILEKHLSQVQQKERGDREKRQGKFEEREKVAHVEPQGGAATSPVNLTDETAMQQATKNVDARYPDLDGPTRMEKILIERNRIRNHG